MIPVRAICGTAPNDLQKPLRSVAVRLLHHNTFVMRAARPTRSPSHQPTLGVRDSNSYRHEKDDECGWSPAASLGTSPRPHLGEDLFLLDSIDFDVSTSAGPVRPASVAAGDIVTIHLVSYTHWPKKNTNSTVRNRVLRKTHFYTCHGCGGPDSKLRYAIRSSCIVR